MPRTHLRRTLLSSAFLTCPPSGRRPLRLIVFFGLLSGDGMKLRAIRLAAIVLSLVAAGAGARAQTNDATKQLAHDIYKQLVEINTTDSVGSTTVAADAMAKRLRDAGFPASDIYLGGPNARKGNLVARLHGTGAHKPILLIGHLDV